MRSPRSAIAPTFGAGLSLFVADFVSVAIEWRALPFAWNTSGFDVRGPGPDDDFPDNVIDSEDRLFKFNHMVSLGVGFFLPPAPALAYDEE